MLLLQVESLLKFSSSRGEGTGKYGSGVIQATTAMQWSGVSPGLIYNVLQWLEF